MHELKKYNYKTTIKCLKPFLNTRAMELVWTLRELNLIPITTNDD